MIVKLHDPHRQAVRVRVLLAIVGDALPVQFRGPGLKRQTIRERRTNIPERAPLGDSKEIVVRLEAGKKVAVRRRGFRARRGGWRRRPSELPHAAKIRLAVRSLGSWSAQVRLSIGSSGNAGRRVSRPLSEKYCWGRGHQNDREKTSAPMKRSRHRRFPKYVDVTRMSMRAALELALCPVRICDRLSVI